MSLQVHSMTISADAKQSRNKVLAWQLQVKAELTPETKSRVGVQFKQFKLLGLIPITAPESARGKLDTTYLDEELRVSRGDRGNLFVLERYEDLASE